MKRVDVGDGVESRGLEKKWEIPVVDFQRIGFPGASAAVLVGAGCQRVEIAPDANGVVAGAADQRVKKREKPAPENIVAAIAEDDVSLTSESGRVIGDRRAIDGVFTVQEEVERKVGEGEGKAEVGGIGQHLEEEVEVLIGAGSADVGHLDDVGDAVGRQHDDAVDGSTGRRRAAIGEVRQARGQLEAEAVELPAAGVGDLEQAGGVGGDRPGRREHVFQSRIRRGSGNKRIVDEIDRRHWISPVRLPDSGSAELRTGFRN